MLSFTCLLCKHYKFDNVCIAFPDGIPISIVEGKNSHSKPLSIQDNKIVFEPIEE
jgi:hypothetical protein